MKTIINIVINTENIKKQYDKFTLISLWNSKNKRSKTFFVNNKFIKYNEAQDNLLLGISPDFEYTYLPDEKTDELPKIKGNELLDFITLHTEYVVLKPKNKSKINLNIYK